MFRDIYVMLKMENEKEVKKVRKNQINYQQFDTENYNER